MGLRLSRGGGRIRLRKDLEVTHLKRWTLVSLIRTDVRQRALPWSALLLADGRIPNHLNVNRRARLAVALALVLLVTPAGGAPGPGLRAGRGQRRPGAAGNRLAALEILRRRARLVVRVARGADAVALLRVFGRRVCLGVADRRLAAAAHRPSAGAGLMHVNPVLIAGAGPAGLTAALELSRAGVPVVVHEAEYAVGGIARTETYRGYRFDIGGHRFYTKVAEVERLWHELLGNELIRVPRLSRIFYQGRYYAYPLQLPNVVRNLGAGRKRADDVELSARAAAALRSGRDARRLGREPLWPAAVRDVLQDLHREGLGPALQRHPRRLGGAAHPGSVVQPRRLTRDLPPRADDVAGRRVPVSRGSGRARCGSARPRSSPPPAAPSSCTAASSVSTTSTAASRRRRWSAAASARPSPCPTSSAACRCRPWPGRWRQPSTRTR